MSNPRKLPVFHGWTVDERLQEFRKVRWTRIGQRIFVVSFKSDAGDRLYARFLAKK